MGQLGVTRLTGEGSAGFGVGASVYDVPADLIVAGNTQFLSEADTKRIMHAGWWALVYLAGGALGSGVTYVRLHHYFGFSREHFDVNPTVWCDGIIWKIPLGIEWDLNVYW